MNRYVTRKEDHLQYLMEWNSLDAKVNEMLNYNCRFPKAWRNNMDIKYSVFKSDHNMLTMQDVHCNVQNEFQYSDKSKVFPFVIMIGLEKYSFLDFQDYRSRKHQRLTIQRGDVFFSW